MSLIIRRVENISKKKRKSSSTSRHCRKEAFEDDASKFTVIEDFYSENFPPLRPVYRKDIFGTPIVFRVTNGIDYYGDIECSVIMHCITFMKEYKNKSFEELRWEDYSCGRKEILHYEENSYLKCLYAKAISANVNYEFFDPVPKNIPMSLTKQKSLLSLLRNTNSSLSELISKKIQNVSKTCRSLRSSVKSSKSFDELLDSEKNARLKSSQFDNIETTVIKNAREKINDVKTINPRSILTYVDKLSQTSNKQRSSTRSSSNVCLNAEPKVGSTRQGNIEMLRNNLLRYFEKAEPNANMPYDLIIQNPKFYLPCAEIGFVYQNARPSTKLDEPVLNIISAFSNYCQKIEPNSRPDYCQYSDNRNPAKLLEKVDESTEWRYNCPRKFNQEYFWNEFFPYCRCSKTSKTSTRAKYILAGIDIIG